MLTAIVRRASFNCHPGMRSASNSKLIVEAKVENERENLIGLIQGFTPAATPGADEAKKAIAANAGTANIKAQPSRESNGSLASSSLKNSRTATGDIV